MQQREKILAIGLGGVVGLYVITQLFAPLLRGPIDEREQARARAIRARDAAETEEAEAFAAIRQLQTWREQTALGGDELAASQTYYEWLTDTARASGWDELDLQVNTRTRPINAAARPIEVRGRAVATADELGTFLAAYDAAPILHSLARLEVTSESSEANAPLQIELSSVAILFDDDKPEPLEAAEDAEQAVVW